MATNNFSGFGGGVSGIAGGPLIVTMTVDQAITGSPNAIVWNNIQNSAPWMSYDTTNGNFTANFPGIYSFQFFYSVVGTASQGNIFDVLYLNGVQQGAENLWTLSAFNPTGNIFIFNRFHEFLLAVGDQLQLQVQSLSGSFIQGNPIVSRANVMLIQGGS